MIAIAQNIKKTPTNLHIRIDFSSIGYIPITYFSETRRHLFDFPVLRRVLTSLQNINEANENLEYPVVFWSRTI